MGILSKLFNLNVKTIEEPPVNSEVTTNNSATEGSFLMLVEDVFTISGRGTVIVGKISQGTVNVGDTVKIGSLTTTVTGLEMFRKQINSASEGDTVGMILDQIDRSQIFAGDVITK